MGILLEEKIDIGMNMDASDVFQTGNYEVKSFTVTTSHSTKPPVDVFIVSPVQKGTYPLLLFCHGFMLTNTWYTTLLNHIASHGYILIAPKYYGVISCSITEEVRRAAKVTKWLSSPTVLPLVLSRETPTGLPSRGTAGAERLISPWLSGGLTTTSHPERRRRKGWWGMSCPHRRTPTISRSS